jgi:hypothetical protein
MVFVSGLSWEKIPRLMLQRISWVPYKMGITTITLKIKDNFLFLNVWKFCREKKVKTAVVRHLLGWLHNRSLLCRSISVWRARSHGISAMQMFPSAQIATPTKNWLKDWSHCINNQGRFESYLYQSTLRPKKLHLFNRVPHWSSNVDLKKSKADF